MQLIHAAREIRRRYCYHRHGAYPEQECTHDGLPKGVEIAISYKSQSTYHEPECEHCGAHFPCAAKQPEAAAEQKQHSGKRKRPKALRKQHSAHEHTQRREEGYKRINRFFTLNASSISVFSVGLELARLLQLCGYFHADCRAYEPERHSTERGKY